MRRPFTLTAALALVLCAGCDPDLSSGGASGKAPSAPVADHAGTVHTAAAATRATTARTSQTVEVGDGARAYVLTVAGDFDMAADKGALSVDFPGGAISHLDEVFADGNVYVRASAGPDKDPWGSIPRAGATAHAALRAPLNDPEHVLEQVAALTDVSKGNEEDLDGVKAVHYYGLLPYEALTSRLAPDVGLTLDTLRTQLGGAVPVAAEVWVDGQGRVVRTRMTLSIGKVRSVTTVVFTELGKPVRIVVPPAGDIVPARSSSGVLIG
ncbi:hypothetical protein [Streptomyces sp. NBC_01264]|uniref:hypothetical protein n=1 Tax=Streptomyces sp. NBC_01264 TaxID=2903804 RepID=UPI002255E6DF|nr:hypothetical protein [Streptomyces sp. NBC_01264]MCX4782138.1 hypothetical protein [Streptomyces sp. NBC_01264]